jgi:hypothetical protein
MRVGECSFLGPSQSMMKSNSKKNGMRFQERIPNAGKVFNNARMQSFVVY